MYNNNCYINNNNKCKSLPLYLHQNILKYCWFDNSSEFKWKLSLSLISKKHFEYISKLYTNINYQLLKENSLLIEKLENPLSVYKYPSSLKCSINQLYSFVRSYYYDTLFRITNGNLSSLNLKLDEPILFNNDINIEPPNDEMFVLLLPKLIEDSKELEIIKIKSPFNFISDYKSVLLDPLLDKSNLKELSLQLANLNIEQYNQFLKEYNNKKEISNSKENGLERIKIKAYQSNCNSSLVIDNLPFNTLFSIKSLKFSNIIINEPSKFIKSISNLNNLKDLSIDNLNLLNLLNYTSINEYQEIFNNSILKYLKIKPHQLKKLELPFPIDKIILEEIASNNQSIESLSVIPNSMVKFNQSLNELYLKSGYSVTTFQQFCELNQNNSSISKITINNNQQFPNYLVNYFNLFIKNNNNLTKLNINQSFSLIDIDSILKSININNTINTLSIQISENSPQFNNTNYLFHLLSSNNNSIYNLNLKIYYYFQVKLSFIDSKQFNLINQKDNFKFKYLRNLK